MSATDLITLPGTMQGANRIIDQCAPVVATHDHSIRGVVVDMTCGEPVVGAELPWTEHQTGALYETRPADVRRLSLVLDHRTGRAHAQWWLLAESIRLRKQRYPQLDAGDPSDWVILSFQWEMPPYKRHDRWRFRRFTIGRGYVWDSEPTLGRPWEYCPALADLDPSDRTLLPDGSRRVVALALQAVCLHVAEAN